MGLFIQDRGFRNSQLLHETLLDQIKDANYGAAMYAFASHGGVELLLEDPIFINFITTHQFNLIVGTDAITNLRTVEKLRALTAQYPNLNVKAYLNDDNSTIFHPKISWFKKNNGGVIVVGSGNLTIEGLRKNREAFGVILQNSEEIAALEQDWSDWVDDNDDNIRELDDPEIIARVKENHARRKPRARTPEAEDEDGEIPDFEEKEGINSENDEWASNDSNEVLIAEIPKASNRWNQANFNKDDFSNFFGGIPGINGTVIMLLRHINDDGSLAALERRPGVSVASRNFRIELAAAASRNYPLSGRPIGVYVKLATRMFMYRLIFPDSDEYGEVSALLDTINTTSRSDHMRRGRTDLRNLKERCSHIPL